MTKTKSLIPITLIIISTLLTIILVIFLKSKFNKVQNSKSVIYQQTAFISPKPISSLSPTAKPSQVVSPSINPSSSNESINIQDLYLKDAIEYRSENLKISFTLPVDYKKIRYDQKFDYGRDNNSQALVRSLRIENNTNGSQIIDFDTAISLDDIPFTYEGTPNYLIGKVSVDTEVKDINNLLIKYYMNPIYVQKIYLESLATSAYVVYHRDCYGSCSLARTYLIPWEKVIDSKIYHNLSVTFYLGDVAQNDNPDPYDLQYLTFNPNQLKQLLSSNFDSKLFPSSTQDLMKIQDDLVKSIKILN